jgi:hypothetical protein
VIENAATAKRAKIKEKTRVFIGERLENNEQKNNITNKNLNQSLTNSKND